MLEEKDVLRIQQTAVGFVCSLSLSLSLVCVSLRVRVVSLRVRVVTATPCCRSTRGEERGRGKVTQGRKDRRHESEGERHTQRGRMAESVCVKCLLSRNLTQNRMRALFLRTALYALQADRGRSPADLLKIPTTYVLLLLRGLREIPPRRSMRDCCPLLTLPRGRRRRHALTLKSHMRTRARWRASTRIQRMCQRRGREGIHPAIHTQLAAGKSGQRCIDDFAGIFVFRLPGQIGAGDHRHVRIALGGPCRRQPAVWVKHVGVHVRGRIRVPGSSHGCAGERLADMDLVGSRGTGDGRWWVHNNVRAPPSERLHAQTQRIVRIQSRVALLMQSPRSQDSRWPMYVDCRNEGSGVYPNGVYPSPLTPTFFPRHHHQCLCVCATWDPQKLRAIFRGLFFNMH